ncbi:MAG: Zn-dependent alcohol dehydrogenase [Deltaproteobacteria bacterium]|nr:Zn-dependent alcohol dehydrogenase [Deltaproteobacteria bacterium]
MKAAILWEHGRALEVRDDVSLLDLASGDVHIQVVSSGVCRSDLSAQQGVTPAPIPCVLGHEAAGIVREVGSQVRDLAAGDPVIVSFTPACRRCRACLRGQANLCETMVEMAITPRFKVGSDTMTGLSGCGSFSEEMIVPESAVIKVDEGIPLDVVSLIGCGVMTGVGAAINTARITPGSSVCVIGCGGIGVAAIQGARIAGAAEIVAVDSVESKLEMARRFGATHIALFDDLEQAKIEVTGGEGFDYTLECVGSPQTIRAGFDAARRGGTAVVVGMGGLDQHVTFNAFELLFSEKKLLGSMYGSANVRVDFPRLLRLWKAGRLDLEGMITRRLKLEEVNEAFRAMQAGEVIRSVIDHV